MPFLAAVFTMRGGRAGQPGRRPTGEGTAMSSHVHTLRQAERFRLVLPARCRTRSGFLDRVMITDLSIAGCRIESRALSVHEGDLVVVRPEGIEGLCGTVRWVQGHTAGIAFETTLYPPVVDHLHRTHLTFAAGKPLRSNEAVRYAA
jgi:hypothetical protein